MLAIEMLKNMKWKFLNLYNKRCFSYNEEDIRRKLEKWYQKVMDYSLNLENPMTFNEKIQWLKLYDSTLVKARLADKYFVRDWIKEQIGEEYLIPLLGVWDRFEDIDFSKLPNSFVLKTNHASSTNIIVKDKSTINFAETKLKFKRWMNTNYGLKMGYELHYGMIKPKIICEKYMGENLTDYKLFCFNGIPEFFWVDIGRYSKHCRNTYDLNWNELPFLIDRFERCNVEKPVNMELMINIAHILSQNFAFVRVDFYEIEGVLYFGEMTFTSSSGKDPFDPEEYDYIYGKKIKLPEKNHIPIEKIYEIWS